MILSKMDNKSIGYRRFVHITKIRYTQKNKAGVVEWYTHTTPARLDCVHVGTTSLYIAAVAKLVYA